MGVQSSPKRKPLTSGQLRQLFLDYFHQQHRHTIVPSSSLVPAHDPTLLFTNAGMVQFKDTFLGLDVRSYTRAVSSQRCVRAGGKHNDLENVGYTARHHTFFEMLGNFSFGDYFKEEAIQYAWEFLTQVLKLPESRLWITVYEKDDETADIWLRKIGINSKQFSRCGAKDNFWSMGDTGPCGPCTEIFYDHGSHIPGGPPGSQDEDEGERYIEIWNLVFMQYNRDSEGVLTPLPKPSVDTGMGLERMTAVMQGVQSNYDIDVFKHLIKAVANITKTDNLQNQSLRVIADHIRACAFLIVDGIIPSNEGRGYVLRRICRRAIRHGYLLGQTEPFLCRLVKSLAQEMGDAYPELLKAVEFIERILNQEELQFSKTLENGLKILEEDLRQVSGNVIPGDTVFRLYDTYGFPVDLTADIARERSMTIDMEGFNQAMEVQRKRARGASQFVAQTIRPLEVPYETEFTGYDSMELEAKVIALYQKEEKCTLLQAGDQGIVVLDRTPFYAESGGQVGDQGDLQFSGGVFEVQDTRRQDQAYMHYGILKEGTLVVNNTVLAIVNPKKRRATALNHSATHLLHAALQEVVGTHVQQKGSLVEPTRLRFDFSHFEPLTREQIQSVERIVNEQIRLNSEVKTELMSIDEAQASGAMALFGEKYDKNKKLRVLRMGGDFSVELCGGTHVKRTGDIGFLKITSESGISSGVRRIEALTGEQAMFWVESLMDNFEQLSSRARQLEKEVKLKSKQVVISSTNTEKEVDDLMKKVKEIKGVKVLAVCLSVGDIKVLRETVDNLKNKLKTAVVVLAGVQEQKVNLVAGVTKDCIEKIQANDLINRIAKEVGGQGGGRPDMAQAGGNNPDGLGQALALVYEWVEGRLQNV